MNAIDIVILLLVVCLLFVAVKGTLKHFGRKGGGCCGCSGCSECSDCSSDSMKKEEKQKL